LFLVIVLPRLDELIVVLAYRGTTRYLRVRWAAVIPRANIRGKHVREI
jgi:hypothetical protein